MITDKMHAIESAHDSSIYSPKFMGNIMHSMQMPGTM